MNFHYSVTIDLFGADQSSNAAIFYSSGLKGRFKEAKRDDDHVLKDASYRVLDASTGAIIEREVPMLNALNECCAMISFVIPRPVSVAGIA